MALMLRKACQPVLSEFDIDNFFADIDENSKILTIYTPCGKTLSQVHGVKFAITRPSKDEITYAVELLRDWLTRNRGTIEKFIVALENKARYGIEDDDPRFEQYGIVYESEYNSGKRGRTGISQINFKIPKTNITVCIDGDLNFRTLNFMGKKKTSMKEVIALSPDILKEVADFAKVVKDSIKYSNAVEAILNEMNTCKS